MSVKITNLSVGFLFLLILPLFVYGQYKFEGALRNTQDYTDQTGYSGVQVTVYLSGGLSAGTQLASSLTNCQGGSITNPFTASQTFCFRGPQQTYDIDFCAGPGCSIEGKDINYSNKTRFISEDVVTPGMYKLTDFGAIGDGASDNTYLLKSAMAYIGSRLEPGGRLIVTNGVFKVFGGTAAFPILLPPGLTLQGQNGKNSFGSSRIQLAMGARTLLKIGNNTPKVTIRDMSFIYYCEVSCGSGNADTRAIYAAGNGISTLGFNANNINIDGFQEGLSVEGLDSAKGWQFGNAKLENSLISCLYPVRLYSQNAELVINNSLLLTYRETTGTYANQEAAIRIDRSGAFEMYKVYGGTVVRNVNSKPLAFVLVKGRHGPIAITESESENTEYSFLYDYSPPAEDIKMYVTFNHAYFGDLVVFKGNVVFKSFGSEYAADGVQFWGQGHPDVLKRANSTASEIYSYGDTFEPLTHKLYVCPAASGVTPTSYPLEQSNGDFHRLSDADITPDSSYPDKNVCRRDFYLYNSSTESNRVVARTAQRAYSTGDSDSLGSTTFHAPVQITGPPVFDTVFSRPGWDRFKTWGYTLRRNSSDGALEFVGNQRSPAFPDGNYTQFRFNGGVYPDTDNQYELGNASKRWALVRGVVVTAGDAVLSDRETGKELYKIHEDEGFIYFSDIRTGKMLMKLGADGNLYIAGKVIQGGPPPAQKSRLKGKLRKVR